jgi:hypothetical protein
VGKFEGYVDIKVWFWSSGIRKMLIAFSGVNVHIYQIQQFMSNQVVISQQEGTQDVIDLMPPNMDKKQMTAGNIIDYGLGTMPNKSK